jgi:hypothetical protein
MSEKIGSVVQRGDMAHVYDEKGRTLVTLQSEGVVGYTSTTVSVKRGPYVFTHDSRGRHISTQ